MLLEESRDLFAAALAELDSTARDPLRSRSSDSGSRS